VLVPIINLELPSAKVIIDAILEVKVETM